MPEGQSLSPTVLEDRIPANERCMGVRLAPPTPEKHLPPTFPARVLLRGAPRNPHNPRAAVESEGVRHKPLHGRVTEDDAMFHQQNSRAPVLNRGSRLSATSMTESSNDN